MTCASAGTIVTALRFREAITPAFTTPVIAGSAVNALGQLTQRDYANGVERAIQWDAQWQAPSVIQASFNSGADLLQQDVLKRDTVGRLIELEDARLTTTESQCYIYDGFNRLESAWTEETGTGDCAVAAPVDSEANTSERFWDVGSGTGFATTWEYSDSGRILSILNQTVDAGVFGAPTTETFGYTDVDAPHAATGVTGGPETKSFVYDDAGRMTQRTIDTVDTDLVWDVTSRLVSSTATPLATEPDEVYVYDAGGQRVAKISLLNDTATAYFGATEVTDPDPDTATTATGDLAATRYYTFAGATVAVQAPDASTTAIGGWSYLFGDFQGSAQLMMEVAVNAAGVVTAAASTDVVTRNAYTPYGARRGCGRVVGGARLAVPNRRHQHRPNLSKRPLLRPHPRTLPQPRPTHEASRSAHTGPIPICEQQSDLAR